jgi:hypothetical protein
LCRVCHDLTYQSCIDGKSTTAFLAAIGAEQGMTVTEVKSAIADDTRARNKWRRKRDQREDYQERLSSPRVPEKSLKRAMLEAKTMSDMLKVLGPLGNA